jgi:hypothetical protein
MESIHNYEKALESITRRITEARDISKKNKELLEKFRDDCFANNIGLARIIRYLYALRDLSI